MVSGETSNLKTTVERGNTGCPQNDLWRVFLHKLAVDAGREPKVSATSEGRTLRVTDALRNVARIVEDGVRMTLRGLLWGLLRGLWRRLLLRLW
jgi:hypothetical protein